MKETRTADSLWVYSLLIVFTVLSLGAASHESATYDEPIHILAGVVAWRTGQINLENSNPPLAVYWQTLPLLLRHFHTFPPANQLVRSVYSYSFGFVHYNQNSLAWMLQAPRAMNVLLALFLGLALFNWTREALGSRAARGALLAYALCPVFIGYGSLVKADVAGALGWLLVCSMAWRWRRAPNLNRAVLTGLALGAALCSKYSSILSIPAVAGAILLDLYRSSEEERPNSTALAQASLAVLLGTNLVMMLLFRGWGLPEWLHAFSRSAAQFKEGHANYYWGQFSRKGWPTYFLTAFVLKTPLPFLIALVTAAFGRRRIRPVTRRFLMAWCVWPAALLFIVSSFSTIQVGIRHILPVYPFLCMIVGAATAGLWAAGTRAAQGWVLFLGLWYAAGSVFVFPRYLSYFNELVGPSSNGYRYFVDSNLDWGQGLKSLADYLNRQGSPPIYFSYFGCSDPGLYGIHFQPVLMTTCADMGGTGVIAPDQNPLYFAVSATNRVGLYYQPHDAFAWLDNRKPVKVFMDSIWLYDVTNDPEAKTRLEALTSPPPPAR